jgi:cell division septum initiation protein DivIVA
MVKAIQELKSENDELKDKLAKFEQMQSVLAGEIVKLKSNNADTKEAKLTEK